jgi:hypothetical protein
MGFGADASSSHGSGSSLSILPVTWRIDTPSFLYIIYRTDAATQQRTGGWRGGWVMDGVIWEDEL